METGGCKPVPRHSLPKTAKPCRLPVARAIFLKSEECHLPTLLHLYRLASRPCRAVPQNLACEEITGSAGNAERPKTGRDVKSARIRPLALPSSPPVRAMCLAAAYAPRIFPRSVHSPSQTKISANGFVHRRPSTSIRGPIRHPQPPTRNGCVLSFVCICVHSWLRFFTPGTLHNRLAPNGFVFSRPSIHVYSQPDPSPAPTADAGSPKATRPQMASFFAPGSPTAHPCAKMHKHWVPFARNALCIRGLRQREPGGSR
jgi:hypothetical protein